MILTIILGLFTVGCENPINPTDFDFYCFAPDYGNWYCPDQWDGTCDDGIHDSEYEEHCEDYYDEYFDGCDCVQYLP